MQRTLINRNLKSLPVVLSLKKVKFLLDTIAWVGHGEFERLAGRLVRCLKEKEINAFWALLVKGCHITEPVFQWPPFQHEFSLTVCRLWYMLANYSWYPCSVIGRRPNASKWSPNFPHYCPNRLVQHSPLKYSTIISIHRGTVVHARLATKCGSSAKRSPNLHPE